MQCHHPDDDARGQFTPNAKLAAAQELQQGNSDDNLLKPAS
jgi:hypothetical protein